jgi:hypothetical protein
MKHLQAFFLALAFFFCSGLAAYAQDGFDASEHRADPNTKMFSDGKHTVSKYVLSQLEKRTNCCGMDDIYLEVKYNENGYTVQTRVLNASNECNRQALPDIMKYVRWKVKNPDKIRPVYLSLKPVVDCEDTENDNVYEAIPEPSFYPENIKAGATASGGGGRQQQQQQKEQQQGQQDKQMAQKKEQKEQDQQQQSQQQEQTPAQPEGQQQPSAKGQQHGGQEMASVKQDSIDYEKLVMEDDQVMPPPDQFDRKNRNPKEDHADTHTNVDIPDYSTTFREAKPDIALRVKRELRKQGICGLAHVFVELRLAPSGEVTGVRWLQYNEEEVKQAALPLLANMAFQSTASRTTYPYFEMKTFIDCDNMPTGERDVDDVPDYFYGPGEKKQKEDKQKKQGGEGGVRRPTDQ